VSNDNLITSLSIFVVAGLYSAVGHGGASGYLAILALANVDSHLATSTALLLNTIVSTIALLNYSRAGHLKVKAAAPFVFASVPFAFMGGLLSVSSRIYETLLAAVLTYSAYRLWRCKELLESFELQEPPSIAIKLFWGAALGLLSGILGIGGGIFLSPILLFKRWQTPQQTSSTAALFICSNSLSGIVSRVLVKSFAFEPCLPMLLAAVMGGFLGSWLGALKLSRLLICRVLALVLLLATVKLLIKLTGL
jgi:uncharacterized membrane protein YfcA